MIVETNYLRRESGYEDRYHGAVDPSFACGERERAAADRRPNVIWHRLVGIPFRDKGRAERGLDCWGLVWLAHKLMGNDLPMHGEATFRNMEDAAAYISGAAAEGWLHVRRAEEQAFDMAVLSCPVKSDGRWVRLDCHVGLVTARGRLLHCEEKTGVVHLPFDHPTVARRISRIYRHEAFA